MITVDSTPLIPFARADVAPPPAGGGPVEQLIFATVVAVMLFGGITLLALNYRRGRNQWLGRAGEFVARSSGLPGWSALPLLVVGLSLILAVFGLYWDIGIHIQNGRDKGPLSSAAHYPIMFGLFGALAAGILAMVLPRPGTRPSPWAVRVADGWYAPVGGILIVVSTAFGLVGFPLDDYWHRLFGQDVTLWGPTHALMLTGAGLGLVGAGVLLTEGTWAARNARREGEVGYSQTANKLRRAAAGGGLLTALSIYQGEFDYGIAQFQMLFHPLMIMVAAGVALTYARIVAGRGGALMAALFFIALRGVLTLLVHFGIGMPVAHFPLYLASAVAVELVALLMADRVRTRPIQFGLAAGLGVGTVGLAGAWLWSQLWIPYPWTSALLPEGVIVGLAAALAGGVIGAWMGNSLMLRARPSGALRFAPLVGLIVIAAFAGYSLHQAKPQALTATITNTPMPNPPAGEEWVKTHVKLNTTRFDEDKKWAVALAWQGNGYPDWHGKGFFFNELAQVGPGEYETRDWMPVFGSFKSIIRFHSDNALMGAAIFQPEDSAIPHDGGRETPALGADKTRPFTVVRTLQPDREILQREATTDNGWLGTLGYLVLLAIALTLLATMAWGVMRISRPLTDEQKSGRGLPDPVFGSTQRRRSTHTRAKPSHI